MIGYLAGAIGPPDLLLFWFCSRMERPGYPLPLLIVAPKRCPAGPTEFMNRR